MIILHDRYSTVQEKTGAARVAFRASRWVHKYIGLGLILFMIWMSVSGILMNHPRLISGVSVPAWLLPPQYVTQNWNRSALINLVYSPSNPQIAYAAGKLGIYKSEDGARTFRSMMDGLPDSWYYRKTRHLLLLEDLNLLLAATDGGLYVCDPREEKWRHVPLGAADEKVVKVIEVKENLVAVTPSHVYVSPKPPAELRFTPASLKRAGYTNRISLVKLFFDLHDGKVWGLTGKLLFDLTGLILIFLSVSAFYAWYFPWQRRRQKNSVLLANPHSRKVFKFLFKYHLKIGIWIAVILLVIGGTGLFMRPPLLVALAGRSIPAGAYPGFLENNPWLEKIQNALYDAVEDKFVLQCTDGFWASSADFSAPFRKTALPAPVFVMGATVFEPYGTGGFLVGSFSGIYHVERATGKSIDLLTNQEAADVSAIRPAEFMVTGYFTTPDGEAFITTHKQGLVPLGAAERGDRFNMPEAMRANIRMPLWNYLFEIHNGRFFQDLVGKYYILILPLGSLLFLLITLTGIYDWLFQNVLRKRFNNGVLRP